MICSLPVPDAGRLDAGKIKSGPTEDQTRIHAHGHSAVNTVGAQQVQNYNIYGRDTSRLHLPQESWYK